MREPCLLGRAPHRCKGLAAEQLGRPQLFLEQPRSDLRLLRYLIHGPVLRGDRVLRNKSHQRLSHLRLIGRVKALNDALHVPGVSEILIMPPPPIPAPRPGGTVLAPPAEIDAIRALNLQVLDSGKQVGRWKPQVTAEPHEAFGHQYAASRRLVKDVASDRALGKVPRMLQ